MRRADPPGLGPWVELFELFRLVICMLAGTPCSQREIHLPAAVKLITAYEYESQNKLPAIDKLPCRLKCAESCPQQA